MGDHEGGAAGREVVRAVPAVGLVVAGVMLAGDSMLR